ncbi:hypothetical protein [Nostoc sp.]|uniref:hypothetical protein n=1 Tax=Nostoc sp. TaxID=1180 RepID=UPI002FF8B009
MSRKEVSEWECLMRGLPPQDLRQSRNEQYFQPLAGNEVLKGFWLKLTPMFMNCPYERYGFFDYTYFRFLVNA